MLVLSRKLSEKIVIVIGDDIVVVSVERISGNQVRLGFEAPKKVRIFRQEIYPGKEQTMAQPETTGQVSKPLDEDEENKPVSDFPPQHVVAESNGSEKEEPDLESARDKDDDFLSQD